MFVGLAASRWLFRRARPASNLALIWWNGAATALLAAILWSSVEPGGLKAQVGTWAVGSAVGFVAGLLVGRFPRAAGGGLVVVALVTASVVFEALTPFHRLDPLRPLATVQPGTNQELITGFQATVDLVRMPLGAGRWYRVRPERGPAPEPWWGGLTSWGLAVSSVAAPPPHPVKWQRYRLRWTGDTARWVADPPQGAIPSESGSL